MGNKCAKFIIFYCCPLKIKLIPFKISGFHFCIKKRADGLTLLLNLHCPHKGPKRTKGDYYGMYTFAKIKQPINIMIVLHYDKYQKNGKARQMIAIR